MRFLFILFACQFAFALLHSRQVDTITGILEIVSTAFTDFATATRAFNGGNASDFFAAYDRLALTIYIRSVEAIRETKNLTHEDAFKVVPLVDKLANSLRSAMQTVIRNGEILEDIAIGDEFCESVGPPFMIQALLNSGRLLKDLIRELIVRLPRDMIKSRKFGRLEEIPEVYYDVWKVYGGKGGDPAKVPKIFARRGPSLNCPKHR